MKASPCSQNHFFYNSFLCASWKNALVRKTLTCLAQRFIASSAADFLLELRKLMFKLSLLQFSHLKTKETSETLTMAKNLKLSCFIQVSRELRKNVT